MKVSYCKYVIKHKLLLSVSLFILSMLSSIPVLVSSLIMQWLYIADTFSFKESRSISVSDVFTLELLTCLAEPKCRTYIVQFEIYTKMKEEKKELHTKITKSCLDDEVLYYKRI